MGKLDYDEPCEICICVRGIDGILVSKTSTRPATLLLTERRGLFCESTVCIRIVVQLLTFPQVHLLHRVWQITAKKGSPCKNEAWMVLLLSVSQSEPSVIRASSTEHTLRTNALGIIGRPNATAQIRRDFISRRSADVSA